MVYFTGEETADHKRKEKHSEVSSNSTISSYIHNTVTVGTGSYLSPLSITSAGKINPSEQAYAATGLVLAVGSAVGTITNSGAIYGGYGANGYPKGRRRRDRRGAGLGLPRYQ